MAVFLLAGCASQGEMVKLATEQKAANVKMDGNFKVVGNALNSFNARITKLEAAKAEPVRDEKGQFTPSATNVPKAEPVTETITVDLTTPEPAVSKQVQA